MYVYLRVCLCRSFSFFFFRSLRWRLLMKLCSCALPGSQVFIVSPSISSGVCTPPATLFRILSSCFSFIRLHAVGILPLSSLSFSGLSGFFFSLAFFLPPSLSFFFQVKDRKAHNPLCDFLQQRLLRRTAPGRHLSTYLFVYLSICLREEAEIGWFV